MIRMAKYLVLILLASFSLQPDALAEEDKLYSLDISGPLVTLQADCDDPCRLEQVEVVGEVEMKARQAEKEGGAGEGRVSTDAQCYGECKQKSTQLRVTAPRSLKEGMELTIEDQWAHFIFYSVVETDSGPATRRRHHEFRIDRPLIMVSLDDHDVTLRAAVETDPGVIRRKTIVR